MNESQRRQEVSKWKSQVMSSRPTAVLLTVRCDVRYTAEEYSVYQETVKLWGDKSLQKRVVVAFTFGDRQDGDIRQVVNDPPPELKKVLKTAKDRHVVFVNKVGLTVCSRTHSGCQLF